MPERTILVGLYAADETPNPEDSLSELSALVDAAGGKVVGSTWQSATRADRPRSAATYIGRGKVTEVGELVKLHEAQVVVFDNELSPAQIRELEKSIECRVIDRSELILDIFANRARTREAVLQVELAQLQYTAPRLRGMWTHLERQRGGGGGAGMGNRGAGEKQIEVDRRLVSRRIAKLTRELNEIHARKERSLERRAQDAFCVGLVGYTNAGKSTLLNRLTAAGTLTQDALFATLDTLTRTWRVDGEDILLSDTVGFVRKLPHHLVASFRATLAEALHADVLLHVVDASHPDVIEQVVAVEQVLSGLDCDMARLLPVLNKMDRIDDSDVLAILRERLPGAVEISAVTGAGIEELERRVIELRTADWVAVRLSAPAGAGRARALAHDNGEVRAEHFDEEGTWSADVRIPERFLAQLAELCAGTDGTPGLLRVD